jgi:hypothetical protein
MARATDIDVWFANELAKLYALDPTNEPGLLMGFPVWGETYIDRFARFCMPSMLAPANAEALRNLAAKLVIYTAPADFVSVWRKTLPLEQAGIRIVIDRIPPELLDGPDPNHKYQLLGTVQNLLIQRAARTGMGFHMIMPDIVYNERYFAALADLATRHEAVALGCLSSDIETLGPELDAYRSGKALCVPSRALGTLGWKHVHQQTRASLLNGAAPENMPKSNLMVWLGRDAVHIASPHTNPAWIGPRLCRRAPVLTPVTLDAEIPALMPNGFHMPGPDEDMILVELSDDAKRAPARGDLDYFVTVSWMQMNYDSRFLPVVSQRTQVRIDPHHGWVSDADIERHHKSLIDAMVSGKLVSMEGFMRHLSVSNRPMLRQ